ncbi:transcription elongation regulator [Geranomyces michiganensis]|nr:transcription elongation regulator [Geranomyces michiganensis]
MDPLDPEHEFTPKHNAGPRKGRGHRDRAAASEPAVDEDTPDDVITHYDHSVRAVEPAPPPQPPVQQQNVVWTEHRASNGRLYYHNPVTRESRWDHNPNTPTPAGAPVQPQQQVQPNRPALSTAERALALKKIPSTPWAIVLTNTDKEFFYNFSTKEAMWDMPDDLGDLIGQLIAEAMGVDIHDDFNDAQSEPGAGGDHEDGNEDIVQASAGEPTDAEANAQIAGTKRKASDNEATDLDGDAGNREAESKRLRSEPAETSRTPVAAPKRAEPPAVNMEAMMADFMALLREADVSPYTTWEKELPKIIDDPRYAQLPTLKDRKTVFDQYCIIRVAELREAQKSKKALSPKEAYQQLLKTETNARTRWDEFRRKFQRDKRFSNCPSQDREPAFRAHIAELKTAQTRSPKDDFIALLKETRGLHPDSSWRRVQQDIDRDPRYRAVRSSSEREDLFRSYVKTLRGSDERENKDDSSLKREADRKAREAAALRDRQAAIRQDQVHLNREMSTHRHSLQTQDATVVFQAMLLDTVRSADAEWADIRPYLERDSNWPRCSAALDERHMQRLFAAHVAQLHEKRVAAFTAALLQTTDLTTTWEDVRPWILNDPRARKLAPPPPSDGAADDDDAYRERLARVVQAEFEQFQTRRLREARAGLVELLEENNFLKFYVKQAVGEARVAAIENKTEPKEGSEWGWIRLEEIGRVLNEDKRFIQLQPFAAERDQKVKEYVRDLILRYRAEKGGTVDRTLAAATSSTLPGDGARK